MMCCDGYGWFPSQAIIVVLEYILAVKRSKPTIKRLIRALDDML